MIVAVMVIEIDFVLPGKQDVIVYTAVQTQSQ